MNKIKGFLARCFCPNQTKLYTELCSLNRDLAAEVTRRVAAENRLATHNRLLIEHNLRLRELIQKQVIIRDTSELIAEVGSMINDMRVLIDVAAVAYCREEGARSL